MRKPLLFVGMAPSANSNPDEPLNGASGRALARLFGHEHVSDFADAVNLIERYPGKSHRMKGDRFPMRKARHRASDVMELFAKYRVVVVLGAGPRTVFELEWFRWTEVFGARVSAMPHPSGCNSFYHSKKNRARAKRFCRAIIRE